MFDIEYDKPLTAICSTGNKDKRAHTATWTTTTLATQVVKNQISGITTANNATPSASHALDLIRSNASPAMIQTTGSMTEEQSAQNPAETESCLVITTVMMEISTGMMGAVKTVITSLGLIVCLAHLSRPRCAQKDVAMDEGLICSVMMEMWSVVMDVVRLVR